MNTFFKLYPQASAKELVYYVKDGVLPAIGKNYVYDGLAGKAYYMEDDQTKAEVYVKYLDQDLKITQVMQYKLTLEKGDNWKIVNAEWNKMNRTKASFQCDAGMRSFLVLKISV